MFKLALEAGGENTSAISYHNCTAAIPCKSAPAEVDDNVNIYPAIVGGIRGWVYILHDLNSNYYYTKY